MTDFGFTSITHEMDPGLACQTQGYTRRWAAPEVLEGVDRITRKADVFAFGMVVIEVGWSSRPPYQVPKTEGWVVHPISESC